MWPFQQKVEAPRQPTPWERVLRKFPLGSKIAYLEVEMTVSGHTHELDCGDNWEPGILNASIWTRMELYAARRSAIVTKSIFLVCRNPAVKAVSFAYTAI